jgi:nucleotide-binding universal stress UspA family protein
MTLLDSILVTTDFSEASSNAVHRAALIAAGHDARVTLLNVVDPAGLKRLRARPPAVVIDDKVALAQAALGRLAAQTSGRHYIHVTPSVQVGNPLDHICRMANDADLLVIGPRRINPLRSLMLGTPTERLLRLVRRPMLVTKQEVTAPYRKVLVAVGPAGHPEPMLRRASALGPAASLHLIHALDTRRQDRLLASDLATTIVREHGRWERASALRRLQALLDGIGFHGAQVSVDHGDAAVLTLLQQTSLGADLIVMGQGGQSAFCNFLLGNVTQRVLAGAACDVLVMPRVRQHRSASRSARDASLTSSDAYRAAEPAAVVEPATAATALRYSGSV